MSEQKNAPVVIARPSVPLYAKPGDGSKSWTKHLLKAEDNDPAAASNQGVEEGRKEHPFNMAATARFMTANAHHSACIAAKVSASIGLGLEDESVEETLDELCSVSWQDMIGSVAEDFENTGNGYIEVVRKGTEIVGLHHLHAAGVWVHLDDTATMDFHYEIQSKEGTERRFARFGDSERFKTKYAGKIGVPTGSENGEDTISEVIHIKEPTSMSRWYGIPRWLSAVAAVELVMSILQHNYDFFNNRGVPEFILFITGKKVDDEDWQKIESKIQEHIGLGNGYKSMAINLPQEGITVQLEKLGIDAEQEGAFDKMLDSLSMMIVSAHQVPPQLAGIMIPGKLGATNELPNAMATFQTLVIGQKQKLWGSILGCTLGKEGLGIDGIDRKSFTWKKITDEINLPTMDAVARTRTPLGEGEEGEEQDQGARPPEAGSPAARVEEAQTQIRAEDLSPEERIAAVVGLYKEAISTLIAA